MKQEEISLGNFSRHRQLKNQFPEDLINNVMPPIYLLKNLFSIHPLIFLSLCDHVGCKIFPVTSVVTYFWTSFNRLSDFSFPPVELFFPLVLDRIVSEFLLSLLYDIQTSNNSSCFPPLSAEYVKLSPHCKFCMEWNIVPPYFSFYQSF